jgi:outer membrane protein
VFSTRFLLKIVNFLYARSFWLIKVLLVGFGTIGFLSIFFTQFLSEQAEASVVPAETPQKGQRLELKLQDAVFLALQNNRTLKNAYLQRIIARENLQQEEDKFIPDLSPQVQISFRRNHTGILTTNTGDLGLGTTVSVGIPTGGELQANWTGIGLAGSEDSLGQNFSVSFNQPLLRGFGSDINKASISIARLEEQKDLFQLKSTLIDTITNTVIDYRGLIQAQEELKIQQQALASAKRQLEITQAFIDAGRRARVDLIPNQTAVANREVDLLAAQNRLQEAQLQLLQTLDLNQNLELIALETPQVEKFVLPSPTEILNLALANNPSYLSTWLDLDIAQLNLSLIEDNRRWNLNLNLSYDNNISGISDNSSEFIGSLNLNREFFGNLRLERETVRSQIVLQQTQNNLEEARSTLQIQVQNGIREVNFRLTEVEQARRATQLSQQQLEIEREKLRLGRGSIIDAIRFEEDLVNAANRELNAVIAYLNALTRLEQTIGTTLETWNVSIEG